MEKKFTEVTENYLKEIYRSSENGETRVTDVAKRLGRKKSTVSVAIERMKKQGLIDKSHDKYGKIILSQQGKDLAESVLKNFNTMKQFLITVGVPEQLAKIDACDMEHISSESIKKIALFLKFINSEFGEKLSEFNKSIEL